MQYKIKQLKNLEKYGFMDYDFAIEHGFDLNDYDVIYEGKIDGLYDKSFNGNVRVLDEIFYIFNI